MLCVNTVKTNELCLKEIRKDIEKMYIEMDKVKDMTTFQSVKSYGIHQ